MRKGIVAGIIAAIIGGCGLAACGDPQPTPRFNPCLVNPTKQAADGHWVEADDEEMDADPCDSDDFDQWGNRIIEHKVPVIKTSPPKPAKTASSGGGTGGKGKKY